MNDKKHGNLPVLDTPTEPIVAFYLTQETDLPARFQGDYEVGTIKIIGPSGKKVKKPALRVTFSYDQSIEELVGLVAFGSDPRCHVLLPADVASPVHCRIYAQLNSGPRVWLVRDDSTEGTQVEDDETSRDKVVKTIHGRRQAAQGLHAIRVGPYFFELRAPVSSKEVRRYEDWFRLNKPRPVTRSMLDRQLGDLKPDWLRMDLIGKGGYGKVYRYMDKCTALYVAIKEENLDDPGRKTQVKKEVDFMKALRHPYLVDILFSECNEIQPEPKQYTGMPLYLGNLWVLLLRDLDIKTKERIIIQIFEGVDHMHKKQILHRDLKPDNVLWVTESPALVKIGDYGLATSLADHLTLLVPCGTAAYMAPECLQKNVLQTTASDVFSLGATVFAILEHTTVMQSWYIRGNHQYNHAFENVAISPPKLYVGLIQSMMAPNPKDRPSLDLCVKVVKGQHYKWTKGTQLAPVLTAAPIAAGQLDTWRPASAAKQEQTPLDRAKAFAIKRNRETIAVRRQPENRPSLQQALVKHDDRHQQSTRILHEPQAPLAQAFAVQSPKPRAPAPVQGVNFQDGLPSYEEATGQNPFAKLVDSHEVARKRRRSKLNPPQNTAGSIAEQRAKCATQQCKESDKKQVSFNDVMSTSPIHSAVQAYTSATHSRQLASHSASMTRVRGQHSRNAVRRPREHAHALDVRRRGTGRVQKSRWSGIKAGTADMGKGIWQFGRGLGIATFNTGCLTAEGIMMLYDMARGKRDPAPNAALLLNHEEQQLVAGMRVRSQRQEAQRQRAGHANADGEREDVRLVAVGGGRRLRRISEEREVR